MPCERNLGQFIMKFIVGLILSLSAVPLAWAQIEGVPADEVPRHRLVTVSELFEMLDRDEPQMEDIRRHAERDSIVALEALATYLRTRTEPRYFFSPDEISTRLGDFRRRYPEAARQAVENTEGYIRRYGADVVWMIPGEDREGMPHDPNVVRYLAKQANAPGFALADLLSDGEHLSFIREHIRDFVSDYEAGLTQGEPNDVFERFYAGHRTRNWLLMHQLLRADREYGSSDEIFMLRVFLLHGARLFDQSRRFNWGNHQLHGLAGLFEMTLMYPELPVMRYWNEEALKLLLEHLEKEIAEDGFHFERASHYHLLDVINYFRVYRLAELNRRSLPDLYENRFRRMFDAVVAMSLPGGDMPIVQDVSADFDLRSEPVAREMALGALLFSDQTYRFLAADDLPAEYIWFFDMDAPSRYEQLEAREPTVESTSLAASGYYIMRTGWGRDDLYMLIDGGLAEEKPDHTQGGILGLIAAGYGDQFLPNYPVMYRHPSYKTLKNSYSKSVAMVDRRPQGRGWIDNKSRTGFGIWQTLPHPEVHEWTSGDRYDVFRGSHDGYEDLGVRYSRDVYFFKPFFWIVVDRFEGDGVHTFQQIWQGSYEIPPHEPRPFHHEGASFHVPDDPPTHRAVQENAASRLHVVQADPDRMTATRRQDYFVESVLFETYGYEDYSFTTLVYPESRERSAGPRIRHFRRPGEFEEIIAKADERTGFLYFSEDDELDVERVRTDARRIALTYVSDHLDAFLVTDGSRVAHAEFELELENRADVEAARKGDSWSLRLLSAVPVSATFTACENTSNLRLEPGVPLRVQSVPCALTSRP